MQFDPQNSSSGQQPQEETPSASGGTRGFVADLLMGLRFFSRLPTGRSAFEKPELRRLAPVLPLASLLIGLGPALLLALLGWLGLPPLMAAAVAVGAMIAVTGGMGEDALGDAADGLAGGSTISRRLEIMKDSRQGSYGVAAIVLFIVVRVAALGALVGVAPLAAAAVWLAVAIVGRSGSLWLTVALAPARSSGASAGIGRLSGVHFAFGAGLAVVLACSLAVPAVGMPGTLLALMFVALVALGWTRICRNLVGGQTGDLIGALGALLEIASLSAMMIFA